MPSIGNVTVCMDSRGRPHERDVKLQLLSVTCVGWHGRAHEREVKLQLCRRDAQPFAWIGVVERTNAE